MHTKNFIREEAKITGNKLGITWDKFNVEQFLMGMNVELEHGKRNSETNVSNDDPLHLGRLLQPPAVSPHQKVYR